MKMSNLSKLNDSSITRQEVTDTLLSKIVQSGNLAYLSESDRLIYYFSYCKQLGLNPLSRPFDYISEGEGDKLKITLYPNTIAASQLRDSRNVSTRIVKEEILLDGEIYSVLVEARIGDRTEEATGKVGIKTDRYGKPLNSEAKAKAMKKAESQARRRATLAIVGLDVIGASFADGGKGAAVSDMPDDCWTPQLENKLMTIAALPESRPSWETFYNEFTGLCDRCETTSKLELLIGWAINSKVYKAYPENHPLIETHFAIIQERVSF